MDRIPLKVEGRYIFYIEQLTGALAKIQALFFYAFFPIIVIKNIQVCTVFGYPKKRPMNGHPKSRRDERGNKTMKKKLLALMGFSLLSIMVLAGCNNNDNQNPPPPANNNGVNDNNDNNGNNG